MNYFILQTLFWLLLAFVIGLILGRWIKRLLCRQNNNRHSPHTARQDTTTEETASYTSTADKLAIRSKEAYAPPSSPQEPANTTSKSSVSAGTVALGAAAAGVAGHVAKQALSGSGDETIKEDLTVNTPSGEITDTQLDIKLKDNDSDIPPVTTIKREFEENKEAIAVETAIDKSIEKSTIQITEDSADIDENIGDVKESIEVEETVDIKDTVNIEEIIDAKDIEAKDTVEVDHPNDNDKKVIEIEKTVDSESSIDLKKTLDIEDSIDTEVVTDIEKTIITDDLTIEDPINNDKTDSLLSKGVAAAGAVTTGVTAHVVADEDKIKTEEIDSSSISEEIEDKLSNISIEADETESSTTYIINDDTTDTIITDDLELSKKDADIAMRKTRQAEIDSIMLEDETTNISATDSNPTATSAISESNDTETESNRSERIKIEAESDKANSKIDSEIEEANINHSVDTPTDGDLLSKGIAAAGVATAGFVAKATADHSDHSEEDSDIAMRKARQAEIDNIMLDDETSNDSTSETETTKTDEEQINENDLLSKGVAAVSAAGFAGVAMADDIASSNYVMSLGEGASVIAGLDSSNLKIIEGIGSKMEQVLHENDILTWRDLSLKTKEDLSTILAQHDDSFKNIEVDGWLEQACLLANGKVDELISLQNETANSSELEKWLTDN
jgi:predicted flap endonuclease-1-like 5' DNA nuclease